MKDERFEQLMRQALTPQISESELEFREIQKEERIVMYRKKKAKKLVLAALAACLVIGGSCFAASQITAYRSGATPNEYTSYSQMNKAEKEIGYKVHSEESFANGFVFDNMSCQKVDGLDESGNKIDTTKGYTIEYADNEGRTVMLNARKTLMGEAEEQQTPTETKELSGITVNGYCTTYKFVPGDYELTEEDKENLERSDFEISYGTDSVEEMEIHTVVWMQDDIKYSLLDGGSGVHLDEMFEMAKELIEE